MTKACPCGSSCSSCQYESMCAGCLEDKCIHMREKDSKVDHSKAKCQFGKMHGLKATCPVTNPPPPKQFIQAPTEMLHDAIMLFKSDQDEMTQQPPVPDWSLLIPEASDITETTARLGVWADEGEWSIPKFDQVAWDMTGYLFDKIQGAPWSYEGESLQDEDWHAILGPAERESCVKHLLMVDRLPDRMAIQTPPTAAMVAYMNRIYSYQWRLICDEDAPTLWLLTHGYPSYIDWPPAWHWNLGIRMLSSLAEYLASQPMGFMGAPPRTWYPDLSRTTVKDIRVPFVKDSKKSRLMWDPGPSSFGPNEMDWDYFPGIIPFVPGADTHQLRWFAKQIIKMGFTTLAIDAVNSIAHENFRALPEAISTLRSAGAEHVMVYGPWPLHPPSKYIPTRNVSYIPTASHMDMTNTPARYWRTRAKDAEEKQKWKKLPSYRKTNLPRASFVEGVDLCQCPACTFGKTKEIDPRSIWRWGHFLDAGVKWTERVKKRKAKVTPSEDSRLWYQGPSYTVFRKCLHYPPEVQWKGIEDILDALSFSETKLEVRFPDGFTAPAERIHWTWFEKTHVWADGFPSLER